MEIHPCKVLANLMVKVLFRLGEKLRRDGFNLYGEAAVDIQALHESVFLHEEEVVVDSLEHRLLEIVFGEAVDELHHQD